MRKQEWGLHSSCLHAALCLVLSLLISFLLKWEVVMIVRDKRRWCSKHWSAASRVHRSALPPMSCLSGQVTELEVQFCYLQNEDSGFCIYKANNELSLCYPKIYQLYSISNKNFKLALRNPSFATVIQGKPFNLLSYYLPHFKGYFNMYLSAFEIYV